MKEVTVKEFMEAFEGQLVNIEAYEHYGISIDMDKASIYYHEDSNELTFTAGNYNHDGIGTVSINVEDCIESIEIDEEEEEPVFVISFVGYMSNITVTKFKTAEELKEEHLQRKRKNLSVVK